MKVAVMGLGKFGGALARKLCREGAEVLAIDRNVRLVEEVADLVTVAVACDAADIQNLKAYDVGHMDVAVVAIGTNFEASVLVAMHCKSLGVPRVYAKAMNSNQETVLRNVGTDYVIKPEEDVGNRLADHLLHESVLDFLELPEGYRLRRVPVPGAWSGKSLAELKLLDHQLNLLQVLRANREPSAAGYTKIPIPHGGVILQEGDLIDVIGPDKELDKLN